MSSYERDTDASLDEVVDDIVGDPAVAKGSRPPLRSISPDESATVLRDLYAEHDRADATLPAVAQAMGRQIACTQGCAYCCESLILISKSEAMMVAEELEKPENASVLKRFEERLESWRRRAGSLPERGAEALARGDLGRYMRIMRTHGAKRIMCPLNEDGLCTVYQVRPLPCRQSWAVDTPDRCIGSTDPGAPKAELVSHEKYEEFVKLGRRVTSGLQAAMGEGVDRKPLPIAIAEELEARR